MWDQYWRTFIPVQLFIIGICLVFFFFAHAPIAALSGPFIVMEVGAIYGARWAVRLKGPSKDVLPLSKNRL